MAVHRALRVLQWMLFLLVMCLAGGKGFSQTSPLELQATLTGQYAKVAEAVQLKYVDGIAMFRTPDFKAFDVQGRPVNLRLATDNLRQLFAVCLSGVRIHAVSAVESNRISLDRPVDGSSTLN